MELNENSKKIDHHENININITLKEHQLAIVQRCIDIEQQNICNIGIMSDKPSTGKTYCILSLIYCTKLKPNIIIVPQNIINQWTHSIHTFSNNLLKYKKYTEYSDIIDLYNTNNLSEYDIIITTSLYYNVLCTTLNSNNIIVERIFFDEIDSISQLIVNKINSKFTWFVSASFIYDCLTIYKKDIDKELLPYITCKCEDSFIDNQFNLPEKNIYKIICRNIYIDTIFNGIFSNDEFKILNALDYSNLNKKFSNTIAQNDKEAIDLLLKNKIDLIETEKLRIEDLNKQINFYGNNNIGTLSSYTTKQIDILKKQLEKSTKIVEETTEKMNLIKERLVENNCCILCYTEYDETTKKLLSKCCKNIVCNNCCTTWFNKMKKTNCIVCNTQDIKLDNYIVIKKETDNKCRLCDIDFENIDDKYYAECCSKNVCKKCLKEWYHDLHKNKCLICHKEEILFDDFRNKQGHEEMILNKKNNIKYTKKTKIQFLDYFIRTKIFSNQSKVILCSSYIRIFNDIKLLLLKYNVSFKELDDGNINDISKSINDYVYGTTNVLLLNSNLFGCGLNLECTTDIVFLHKTEPLLEKQIIGRAQRVGRKNKLNVWYIMHENENIIYSNKQKKDDFEINFTNFLGNNNENNEEYIIESYNSTYNNYELLP